MSRRTEDADASPPRDEGTEMPQWQDDTAAGETVAVTWSPTVPRCGFYRVRASLNGRDNMLLQRELTLAVVREGEPSSGGTSVGRYREMVNLSRTTRFWTLSGGMRRLDQVSHLVHR